MKQRPVIVETPKPAPEPKPYELAKFEDFGPLSPVVGVLYEKIAPILEKYEFDFFRGYIGQSPSNYRIEEDFRIYDGGGYLVADALPVNIGEGIRFLIGSGEFNIVVKDNIDVPSLPDVLSECLKEIEDVCISAFGVKYPICFSAVPGSSFGMKIGGYACTIISISFQFGYKLKLTPEFVPVTEHFTREEKDAQMYLSALNEKTLICRS